MSVHEIHRRRRLDSWVGGLVGGMAMAWLFSSSLTSTSLSCFREGARETSAGSSAQSVMVTSCRKMEFSLGQRAAKFDREFLASVVLAILNFFRLGKPSSPSCRYWCCSRSRVL
uniref:(northern house mosquito) hypothetical protein n=1 Tax=Culex pipiens TaxID=7175 RepID=A0A8D8H2U6_CULPI